MRKCSAFKLRVLTQSYEGGPPNQQSKIIGGQEVASSLNSARMTTQVVGTATLVVPQLSDTETIYVDEDLLPLGINHS